MDRKIHLGMNTCSHMWTCNKAAFVGDQKALLFRVRLHAIRFCIHNCWKVLHKLVRGAPSTGRWRLSLTLSRPDQLLSISQYMKMYVYEKINFYNIGPRVCCLFCGAASPHCARVCYWHRRVDTFQNARAKALGRRALANKLHFMHQVVVFCAPRLIFPNANKY